MTVTVTKPKSPSFQSTLSMRRATNAADNLNALGAFQSTLSMRRATVSVKG